MSRYSQARKEDILNKMLVPHPPTIRELAQQEGLSEATLYNWRNQLRREGRPVPEHDRSSDNWSAQTKFAVIVETATLSEAELAEYCRAKGLYPEQVKRWREISIQAHSESESTDAASAQQSKAQRKQIKRLEREVLRKDKALAEAAALLILQKKLRALWGANEDD